MAADPNDSRTVLQAHRLRSELATNALLRGSAANRGRSITWRIVLISLMLAAIIVVGIVVTGYVIDLIAARRR